MQTLKVRKAGKSDKEDILSFCVDTFSWGDYIDRVWDMWFCDRNGLLLVAEDNGKKVGLSHMSVFLEGAWLEGVRVHPDYRHQKIATALMDRMLDYAGKKGAREASAIVASDNVASQRMMEKSGFSVISRWVYYSNNQKLESRKSGARIAKPNDLAKAWLYLQKSQIYRQSARRYVQSWCWRRLDRKALRQLVNERRVIVTGATIDGLAILNKGGYWNRKDVLQIVYLDSESKKSLRDLVLFAANLYLEGNFSHLHTVCHKSSKMTSIIEKYLIGESEQFLLYSKKVFTH